MQTRKYYIPVLSIVLFSLFYWYCAYSKPFHVDEFFSWVYAERCSYKEILTLKDGGIGHPPLYHLLQKTVQSIFTEYHWLQVRLVNYFLGVLFVLLLIKIVWGNKPEYLLVTGIAISGCILDLFVFSRMWGLVALLSLASIYFGEKHVESGEKKYLYPFLLLYPLGLFSDFNFLLLTPYFVLILLARRKMRFRITLSKIGLLLFFYLIPLSAAGVINRDGYLGFYLAVRSLARAVFELHNMLFNVWFFEPLILCVLLTGILIVWGSENDYSRPRDRLGRLNRGYFFLVILFLFMAECMIRMNIFRTRYLAPLIILTALGFIYFMIRNDLEIRTNEKIPRLIMSVALGTVLCSGINPFMWREILEKRFLFLFFPLMIAILHAKINRRAAAIFGIIFTMTGINYAAISGISDHYPPRLLAGEGFVYQDAHAFANQYLKKGKEAGDQPRFLDKKSFERNCRVCEMGREAGPDDYVGRDLIAWYMDGVLNALGEGNEIIGSENISLNKWDALLFDRLHPIYDLKFEKISIGQK